MIPSPSGEQHHLNKKRFTAYQGGEPFRLYASGKSADVILWVVKHAREEHKPAIEWLNNHTDEKLGFFLCEIKLYRIGSSEPAVKFEVIEKHHDWIKEVKKNESANETQQQRYDYWVAFQDYAFQNA